MSTARGTWQRGGIPSSPRSYHTTYPCVVSRLYAVRAQAALAVPARRFRDPASVVASIPAWRQDPHRPHRPLSALARSELAPATSGFSSGLCVASGRGTMCGVIAIQPANRRAQRRGVWRGKEARYTRRQRVLMAAETHHKAECAGAPIADG